VSDWISQALIDDHDVSQFDSGNESLDQWLQVDARRAHGAGISRTTVWTAANDRTVVAYHAIAPTQIARIDLPSRSLSGGYGHVPGYLIRRLALDKSLHGQGLGTHLLLDALERIIDAADRAGGRVIVVDAIDDTAHRFCSHHGFRAIEHSNRLVMKLATAGTKPAHARSSDAVEPW
jgi:GNAT superfamily N-acetyltransferase